LLSKLDFNWFEKQRSWSAEAKNNQLFFDKIDPPLLQKLSINVQKNWRGLLVYLVNYWDGKITLKGLKLIFKGRQSRIIFLFLTNKSEQWVKRKFY
jgi:hypothetical protein